MIERARHYSEYALVNLSGHSQVGVISITEPDRIVSRLDNNKWACVLRLYFHDIDFVFQKNHVLFNEDHADQIIDWLKQHEEDITGVYVHCAAGISRSAAVAKFISTLYGLFFDARRGSMFNRHVYSTLLRRAVDRELISVEKLREYNASQQEK